jgi:hypothetical protein
VHVLVAYQVEGDLEMAAGEYVSPSQSNPDGSKSIQLIGVASQPHRVHGSDAGSGNNAGPDPRFR